MLNGTNMPGLDGFVWWTGIVERRDDPEKLSRVQVRMYMWHIDDKSLVPSEKLLWAHPIFPINVSNQTYTVKEGDAVFGFWMDGKDAQQPYIFGRFPDKPEKIYPAEKGFSDPGGDTLTNRPVEVKTRKMVDGQGVTHTNKDPERNPHPLNEQTTSRFARNQNIDETPLPFIKSNIIGGVSTAGGGSWSEVQPDYNTVYPYNDSKQTESGHYFDMDDTKGKERITFTHRTGTMHEIRHTGSSHRKDMKHSYNLVHGSELTNVRGNLWTTVERWTRFKSKGKAIAEINADCDILVGGTLYIEAKEIIFNSPLTTWGPAIRVEDQMTVNIVGGSSSTPLINNSEAPVKEE